MASQKVLPLRSAAAWLIFIAGASYVMWRSVVAPLPDVDFRYFWIAGEVWSQNLDPYGAAYGQSALALLPPGNMPSAWVYPPHWWAICRALAFVGLNDALAIWRIMSGIMLIAGTWILVRALSVQHERVNVTYFAASAGGVCLIEPTAQMIAVGQNSAFIYMGLCALIAGCRRPSLVMQTLAILLLSLKPQVGVPVIMGLMCLRGWGAPVLLATLVGLVMAVPQFYLFGTVATFDSLLGNLAGYSGGEASAPDHPNSPVACTGLIMLLGHVFKDVTLITGYALGALVAVVIGIHLRRSGGACQLSGIVLLVTAMMVVIPLHVYDLSIIVIPAVALAGVSKHFGIIVLAASPLALRPSKIEALSGFQLYGSGVSAGSIVLTLLLLLLLTLAAISTFSGRHMKKAASVDHGARRVNHQ